MSEIKDIAFVSSATADLANWIVQHGLIAVLRSQRQGLEGRLPVLLDAWLVQQGRMDEPKIGPQKLARLLLAHELAEPSDGIERIKRRLEKAALRHPEPVPLAR